MKYEIEGHVIETDGQLSESEIDEIGQQFKGQQPSLTDPNTNYSAGGFLANTAQNAIRAVNPISMASGLGQSVAEGAYNIPKDVTQGIAQGVAGTVTGQEQGPNPITQRLQGIAGSPQVQHPLDYAYKNPIDTAAMLSVPFSALGGTVSTPKLPSAIEEYGLKGLMSKTGIKARTLDTMAKAGENPADVGINLAKSLENEGALKTTPSKTWDAVNELANKAGKDVEDALGNLQKANRTAPVMEEDIGTGATFRDPASKFSKPAVLPPSVDAETALKPVLEGWQKFAGGMTTATKNMAKPFEEVHNALSTIAEKRGGKLTLGDIRDAMQEIGPLTHKGSEETQAAMSELYGSLATAREQMVENIASNAKNPTLAQNLLQANARYSKYIRILPDIARAAGKEVVTQPGLIKSIHGLGDSIIARITTSLSKAHEAKIPIGFPLAASLSQETSSRMQSLSDKLKNRIQ